VGVARATVEVFAPSRLHFGMFSFGHENQRQFGGVGAMIGAPGLRLRASAADSFGATGPLAARVAEFARRVGHAWGLSGPPAARIDVLSAPAAHVGLGVGTQLALAVASALASLAQRPVDGVAQLAGWVARGERSAVGAFGFQQGGLIVEAGKLPTDRLSPLIARHPLPDGWRFVLARPADSEGLSGEAERAAFAALPAVSASWTAELCRLALLGLVPAAIAADFAAFSEALFDYGRLAGRCFAAGGAGSFASEPLERLVVRIRELGGVGVGQSSWGPTLFVVMPSEAAAEDFCERLRRSKPEVALELMIAGPDNLGARLTRVA
jgi:beta-ribofuranosylaminobenzene 5'-phosphate synthase